MSIKTLTAAALVLMIGAPAYADEAIWHYDDDGEWYYVEDGVAYYEDGSYYYGGSHAKKPADEVVIYTPAPRTHSVITSGPAGTAVISQSNSIGSAMIAQSGVGNSSIITQSNGGLFLGRQPTVSIDSPAGSIRLGQQPRTFWQW